MTKFLKTILFCMTVMSSTSTAMAEPSEGKALSDALLAVGIGDFASADAMIAQIDNPVAQTLINWARLRAGDGEWQQYLQFLTDNPDWPGLKRLRKQAEKVIPETPHIVNAFFSQTQPQTAHGFLRLIAAQDDPVIAQQLTIKAWLSLALSEEEQAAFLSKYAEALKDHHVSRLDNLLWRKLRSQADRMKPFVTADQFMLAQARMALQRRDSAVDEALGRVSPSLIDDGGLAFDRFEWRMAKGRWDEAQDLILERTSEQTNMGRPKKWASRRRGFARRAMRAGKIDHAYRLASQHELTSGSDFADLEWLAGYISLIYRDDPKRALGHFETFNAAVKSPISLGRASYWLGRVHEALEDFDNAAIQYKRGTMFQTSFYGQLAAQRIQAKPDQTLAGREEIGDWRTASFANSSVFEAAKLLHGANKPIMTRWFMTHMAETLPRSELLQLADYAKQMGADFVTLGIAKEAAKRGIILPRAYFPITKLADFADKVPPEVAMAIARRESELNPAAISPAGARGLMQIMPATARDVAAKIDVPYDRDRLTSDWEYNATLGTAYLGGLIEKYEGSYVLAFAAYNAGPNRVVEWIDLYGDPRDPLTSVVDWIEHIPFRETRNYVMRVVESLHVYRARISGQTPVLQLLEDLSRG